MGRVVKRRRKQRRSQRKNASEGQFARKGVVTSVGGTTLFVLSQDGVAGARRAAIERAPGDARPPDQPPVHESLRSILGGGVDPERGQLVLDYTLEYVQTAGESTARARFVLTLIVIAAVLTFNAYWTTYRGFHDRRIEGLVNAKAYSLLLVRGTNCPATIASPDSLWRCRQALRLRDELRDAAGEKIDADTLIAKQLSDLRDEKFKEKRTIGVPFFEISFDSGDIGVYVGAGFVLLLFALTYAISTELRDSRAAFQAAKRVGTAALCYELLSMRQVLTIPKGTPMVAPGLWRHAPKAFYFFPLTAQSAGLWLGFQTRGPYRVTPGIAAFASEYAVEAVLWILSACLTGCCFFLERQLDHEWDQRRVHVSPPSGQPTGV